MKEKFQVSKYEYDYQKKTTVEVSYESITGLFGATATLETKPLLSRYAYTNRMIPIYCKIKGTIIYVFFDIEKKNVTYSGYIIYILSKDIGSFNVVDM